MIVEGLIVAAVVTYVIGEPIKTLLLANAVAEATMEKPTPRKVEQGDPDAEFDALAILDDFIDEGKGELHTQFMIAKTKDGEWKLFSKAEIELKKQSAFLKAALERGIPVGPESLRKVIALVGERDKEISRAKSRKVEMKPRPKRKASSKLVKKKAKAKKKTSKRAA